MDTLTAGLVKACAITLLENLPHLEKAGIVGWDAVNAARTQVYALVQQAATDEDREILAGILVRLG